MTIHRQARTPRERELLTLAERLHPAPDTVLTGSRDQNGCEELLALSAGVVLTPLNTTPRQAGVANDRWWLATFDGAWLP